MKVDQGGVTPRGVVPKRSGLWSGAQHTGKRLASSLSGEPSELMLQDKGML